MQTCLFCGGNASEPHHLTRCDGRQGHLDARPVVNAARDDTAQRVGETAERTCECYASIFEHPLWPVMLPHLYIRRGRVGVNGARHRIEVHHSAPAAVFTIVVRCAYCSAPITVVREDARHAWTVNLSCPLAVRPTCARMPATTKLCTRVRAAITERDDRAAFGD